MSTPANPLTDQLPVDPQRIMALQSLFPQQPAAAPATPAQPSSPADITQEMVQASQQGRKIFGEQVGKERGLGSEIESLVQRQQETPIPKTGFMDTQGQPQQGGFLHNLGRALMAVGASTVPGRAIERTVYEPGIKRYEAETGARAKQIEELRGQQEEAGKVGTAAAGMVSKPITAAAQVQRSTALQERADAYSQKVQNDLLIGLRTLDLKKIATGAQAELAKARAVLDRVMAAQAPLRTSIMQEGVELGNATKSAIENVKAQLGIQAEHPLASLMDSVFGTTVTPAAPQTDTGKTGTGANVPPAKPPAKPAKPAKPGAGTVYMEGKMKYTIPAGMEKEFEKDHPNAKRQ